jgi:hypothetical protein
MMGNMLKAFWLATTTKKCCKKGVTKELARSSRFERPNATIANYQLAECFDHPTFIG